MGSRERTGLQEETMSKKLTWQEIEERYRGEWVELIDYEWDLAEINPLAGVVRVHSKNRKEFDKLLLQDRPKDSAVIYIGKLNIPEGMTFSANLHQYTQPK